MSVLVELDQNRAALAAPGQPFELTEARVNGFSLRVYKNLPPNLTHLIVQARRFSDRTFIVWRNWRLTYLEALSRAAGVAEILRTVYGAGPGVHVAIAMRNSPEWILSCFAAWLAGATAVLVNSRGAPDEIVHALSETECKILIADAKRAEGAARGFEGGVLIADDTGDFRDVRGRILDVPAALPLRATAAGPDDPALILFTSGTTGRPKGAVLSHRSVYTCLFGLQHSGAASLMRTAKKLGLDPQALAGSIPQMANLAIMPFFHVSGAQYTVLSALTHGGKIVIMDRWDTATALALIARERISQLTGPPSIFWDILSYPGLDDFDLSSLMHIGTGGQATPPQLQAGLVRAFPKAAPGGGWGLTETNGSISTASGEEWLAKPLASGRILPVADVRIIDEHGNDLPLGAIGEIWVKSALVMTGYWNQPQANQAVFSGGWLRTGDIGFLDADRFITIVDRKKDMIIRGGENIYCAELERVFNEYPGVLEAAAFGVPDERLGERAVVAVVAQPGKHLVADDLGSFARTRLADYKVPSEILFAPAPFLRNVVGKIDRAVLRKNYGASALFETQGAKANVLPG